MKRLLCLALVATGGLAIAPAEAQNVLVRIEPEKVVPKRVTIEIDTVPEDLERKPPAGFGYERTVTLPPNVWTGNYLVVAQWPKASQSLDLRITRNTPKKIEILIYNEEPTPEKSTLDDIDDGKQGLSQYLRRYFVARDVHAKIATADNEVKIRALKIWYDAAFNLAKRYRYIARDEQVVKLADEIEVLRKEKQAVANIITRLAKTPDYFGLMNKEFRALYFDEVALVPQQIRMGALDNAEMINTHFLNVLKALSDDQRAALLLTQGVQLDTLEKNEKFLLTLKGSSQTKGGNK